MSGCKLTKSLDNKTCSYAVAGNRDLFLANYYPPVDGAAAVEGFIAYQFDEDGYISSMSLPTGEKWYRVKGSKGTVAFIDALLTGGNGGKFRQQTVNGVVNQLDIDILNEGDALSLGTFVAAVVDNAGRPVILGRVNGLSAPAGGFDYNSGAADADATGWTLQLQGVSTETVKLCKDESVITPIDTISVIP